MGGARRNGEGGGEGASGVDILLGWCFCGSGGGREMRGARREKVGGVGRGSREREREKRASEKKERADSFYMSTFLFFIILLASRERRSVHFSCVMMTMKMTAKRMRSFFGREKRKRKKEKKRERVKRKRRRRRRGSSARDGGQRGLCRCYLLQLLVLGAEWKRRGKVQKKEKERERREKGRRSKKKRERKDRSESERKKKEKKKTKTKDVMKENARALER